MHTVVMGVSGSGKSTVAALLAERLGAEFAEADDFHPRANVEKMSAGVPLDDDDRLPWLQSLAAWMRGRTDSVVACSALKRRYRDVLRTGGDRVRFVHLAGDRELFAGRMAGRSGHFMAAGLLDSQFADLEPLEPDEVGVTLDAGLSPAEIVRLALASQQT